MNFKQFITRIAEEMVMMALRRNLPTRGLSRQIDRDSLSFFLECFQAPVDRGDPQPGNLTSSQLQYFLDGQRPSVFD